ncbi:MAG: hypothetical protein B6U76_01185 [Desulfurococcales archaeon ex4484_217_2]|nr:MAG: hypothetical protein B6U76_01185 [Desulfurococcales archaeon ex4484_217_2]
MGCEIKLGRSAGKFLRKTSKDLAKRIHERLRGLSENPICEEKLKGRLKELCKTRVGSYRIAYQLKPCTIIVIDIGHRERFYEKLRHLLK